MSTPDPLTQQLNDFVEKTVNRWNLPWFVQGLVKTILQSIVPALVTEMETLIQQGIAKASGQPQNPPAP